MSVLGKVARIIDDSTIVINVGQKDGVEKGMHFVIFEEGEEIQDPNTEESLGRLEIVKAEVEAVHVQDQMTILRSPLAGDDKAASTVLSARLQEGASGDYGSGIRTQKLHVRQSDISGMPELHPISVGDSVRNVAKS